MRNSNLKIITRLGRALFSLVLLSSLTFAQVTVTMPEVTGQQGITVTIPVTVSDLTGRGVLSYQTTVTYDKSIVYITGAPNTGTISAPMSVTVNADTANGRIIIAAATSQALSGSGTLINLTASLRGKGSTALTFTSFLFNEGTPTATLTNGRVVVPQLGVTLGNVTVRQPAGGTFTLPLTTESLTGLNVLSYQFTLSFDTTKIRLTGVSTTGTISSGMTTTINTAVAGRLTLAGATSIALTGSGTLLNLTGTAVGTGTSAVSFVSLLFNEGTPAVGGINGSVIVTINLKPTFSAIAAITKAERDTVSFVVSATDPNPGDVLTYSASGLPTGATFTAATRTFSWVPSLGQAGSYTVKFHVTDGQLTDSTTASITIKPLLRVANPIADITLSDGNRLRKVPLAGVFAGNEGSLSYAATSSDTRVVVSLVTGDSLQVRGLTATITPATVTVTATDLGDGSRATTTFRVTVTGVTNVEPVAIPTEFSLGQNYPNPFNPSTTIRFSLPKEAPVTLVIYNMLGVPVRTLVNGENLNAAYHQISWDGKDDAGMTVPSGIYLYRISAGSFLAAKKMTLLK